MGKITLLLALIICLPAVSVTSSASEPVTMAKELKQQLLGSSVYIQIFKEERTLELYARLQGEYRLIQSYRICNFSGGLGPKRREGDFKSPEGFYSIDMQHLKPDSKFYRAINIGFPNDFDKSQGYSGKYLMIHGDCQSIGCYAMTDAYMDEIFNYVKMAFINGQSKVDISIYPFRMTEQNMQRHRNSTYINFWRQLQPGYTYFAKNRMPPPVGVINGQYVINRPLISSTPASEYALSQAK
ncbi:transpeptidase [Yersinia ruckeri]|uniref:peptidoglycan meso-diaminopimelic acid protein amidase n=1 Tax=Yersinia ruckeri TaxID=29486 RepID=UPI0008FD238F|nr:peptidoglycan meso-diaminopimelic acid protein amidase [Yersinia ruckeri]EKN4183254.1 murein L,D-transpeptidase [Yersinia ruckeri]EKN4184277.1 murein L,D-transpeptidase [Yersinia ruckeri]MCK8554822.1 murein L,D-transpeptidase [Yersinia ruckeri]MCW6522838.1 peptidoglycan meso-diaminopimelic acid protein amidase [Yersinia ruckeri]MCW6605651.1 peptidoglycan meso-diaminopimelic acid protein amidase [Yersinia ruckeri]